MAGPLTVTMSGTMQAATPGSPGTPQVLETATLFTTTFDFPVGIPQNNAAFWDGSNYWIYTAGKDGSDYQLQAHYGPTLESLQPTATNLAGDGPIGGLSNNAKAHSLIFGKEDGQWTAWALINRTPAGQPFEVYRWRLTDSGLSSPAVRSESISNKGGATHATLHANYDSFNITDLYGTVISASGGTSIRRVAPDLSAGVGLGGVEQANVAFSENGIFAKVQGGYTYNAVNIGDWTDPDRNGNYGDFSEWTRTELTSGVSGWSSEKQLESPGPTGWANANYGANTSHAGQTDFIQLADGRLFNAYITNRDTTSGNYGALVLKQRGAALADGWSTAADNVVPGDGEAWHLSLTSDGAMVWVLYVKNNAGARDNAIYLRGFDPGAGTLTDESLIAEISEGARFERMTTQWRFTDQRIVVLWSEVEGPNTTVHATAVAVPEPAAALLLLPAAAAAMMVRPR